MSLKTVPYSNQYVFGRGRLLIGLKNANGQTDGLRPVGNAPEFTISVKADLFQHTSSESGLAEIDFTTPKSVTRSAKTTIDNITDRNLALAIAGVISTYNQAATAVTDEVIARFSVGGHYQLGKTAGNPTGVRKISAFSIDLPTGAAHVTSHPYVAGDLMTDTGKLYVAKVGGTSAVSAPSFVSTSVGATTTDGTVTWAYVGATADTYAADVDYILDTDHALLGIPATGQLAAIGALSDSLPAGAARIGLLVNYTPVLATRPQIKTGDLPQLNAELKYIADNPTGTNRDVWCGDVTITPSGDLSFITADKNMSLTLDIAINKIDSATPALVIDGEAVALS